MLNRNWLGLFMKTGIKYLKNHNPKEAIADVVGSDGSFKFRDHVSKKERITILNWLESEGVKVVIK